MSKLGAPEQRVVHTKRTAIHNAINWTLGHNETLRDVLVDEACAEAVERGKVSETDEDTGRVEVEGQDFVVYVEVWR